MRASRSVRIAVVALLSGACISCGSAGDATGPGPASSPWVGIWTLVSVNAVTVPANVTILGYSARVVSRTLSIQSSGTGIWQDSTLNALLCIPPNANKTTMCNASGGATVTWTTTGTFAGSSLTVISNPATTVGYVVTVKTFVLQADGSLLKTDDAQTEVYRRQ